jgi:hypothetical protein
VLVYLQDISARSPVIGHDIPTRQSLDSARFPRLPRSAIDRKTVGREPPTAEEAGFEDVGLDDAKAHPNRRRGFFSKLTEHDKEGNSGNANANANTSAPSAGGVSRFLIPGRKRGQSTGQGAELGSIERPTTAGSVGSQEAK